MVAVVTGNNLGLVAGSAGVLGNSGQLGSAATGRGGDIAFVNASTGNLTIQRQDELLIGMGPDIGIVRTYNSQGIFDFDNNDNWQISLYRRVFGLTGGLGVANSTVKRTAADGAELIYTYDAAKSTATDKVYVNKDGSGSYDTLTFNTTSNTWTWQDGDSRVKETYEVQAAGATAAEGTHRIKTIADTDGNALTYSYNNATDSLITQVSSANGERTELIYNATKQLTQINVVNSSSVTTTRIRYTYENATATARLTVVSTDLTPADGVIADGKTYTTTYAYDGTSKRIASITNSDGTKTSFTYETSGLFRVLTVKDGLNNTTTFAYPTSPGNTRTITDAKSQVTTLTYSTAADSSNGLLIRIQGPSGSGQDINYVYDANGNVIQMTDSRNNVTKYTYDANGNQTRQEDAAGNTITRSYSATNRLLAETVYATPDSAPGDATYNAALPQTTRYIYDGEEHLRFIVSPEGRVTEYQYNANGTRASVIEYTSNLYSGATNNVLWQQDFSSGSSGLSTLPSKFSVVNGALQITSSNEASQSWPGVSGGNYPLGSTWRGEVTTTGTISSGLLAMGVSGGTYGTADYRRHWIQFSSGRIIAQTRIGTGSAVYRDLGAAQPNTQYVVEFETDTNGNDTIYVYVKGSDRASGYKDTQSFSSWTNVQLAIESYSGPDLTGSNTILVDNLQVLSASTENDLTQWANQTGIKAKSQRTDYTYDVRGQLDTLTTYFKVDAAGAGVDTGTIAGQNVKSTTKYVYDQYGNLTQAIDARGVATTGITTDFITNYSYDGLNRLITQTDALGNLTTTIYNDTTAVVANGGTNIAANSVGVRLANGLVTISAYDLAGRLISIKNTNATNATLGTTSYLYDSLGLLRQIADATGQKTYYLYDNLNRKVGEIDANNNLTEWVYNNNGQAIRTIQYTNAVTATLNDTTALTLTIATAGIRPTSVATDRVYRNLYDKAGRLAKQVDALNFVTEYQYDGASRLVKTTQYANAGTIGTATGLNGELLPADVTVAIPDATKDRVTRQLYSDDGLLQATLDSEGYLTEHIYDAAGQRVRSIRYATITPSAQWPSGTLSALRPAVNAANDQTTHFIYNARGQLEGTVDPLGYLTEYQYDESGNRTLTKRYATAITYTVGASVAASRPASNTEDQSTTNTFDDNNRLKTTASNPDGLSTEYTYDNVGNLTQQVNTYTGAANTDKRSQFKQYDQLGRVTRELSGEGVLALQALVSPTQAQIDTVWDSYGTRYTYDLAGRVIVAIAANGTNANGNKTLYYYDTEGKLRYQINAVGEVTEYLYNQFDQRTTTRQYKTRIATATLTSMQTTAATATTGVVNTTTNTAANTALTALNTGATSYAETLTGYDNAGRATTLTDALLNVNTRTYNAFGELQTRTDKTEGSNTLITSYAYDRRGMVKTTTEDAAGLNRITQAVYDAFGRITQTTDGRNNVVNRTYDRLGREVVVTDALSTQTQTTYDAFSRVLTRRDGRGVAGSYNTVSYVYDTTNRRMTMTTGEGIQVVTEKNRFGETVKVTDGRANVTTYTYNADGQLKTTTTATGTVAIPTTSTTTTNYDAAGKVITSVDARGTQTTFTYDAANRVLSRTVDPTGLNLKTEYRYDALSRQAWVKDAKGIWTRTDYDNKGQVTAIVVDPTAIPTAADANGIFTGTTANATGLNITTNFTYDARGKRLTVVEGAGTASAKTTSYSYDKLGRLTQTAIDPAGLNLRTNYTYDKNDNVVLKVDANGNKTVYTYDANNRLVYTVDALGSVTKQDYDVDGNILTTTAYATVTTTNLATLQGAPTTTAIAVAGNVADHITRNVYDKDSRRTFSIDALGYVSKFEYDANGNVVKTTQYANAVVTPVAGVAPQLLSSAGSSNYLITNSAKDQVTQNVYDAANRIIASTDALGIVTSYTYDANGNQLSVKEGVGTASERTTYQEFDKANRKTAAVDALGNRTETTYDAVGNIVTVKDAKGNLGYFYYDAASRMTLQVNPEGAVTETKYDVLGNQTDIIRYANKVIGTLSVSTRPVIGGSSGTYVTTNANADQLQKVTYDVAGRKLNIKTAYANAGGQTLDGTNSYTESFTYDAFSNVLTSAARNGAVTTYTYDGLNRKATETLPITSRNASNVSIAVQNSFAYDAFGNLTTKTEAVGLPEQRVTSYTYNLNNQQTGESVNVYLNATTTSTPSTKAKTYDARGNLTSETDANSKVTYYYYDLQDRRTAIIDANGVLTTLVYDAVGNKTSQTTYANKVTGQGATNKPTPVTDVANDRTVYYTYDKMGRELSSEIRNMVVGTVDTGSNTYNALTTANLTKQTVYDALGNIIRVIDANGNTTRAYYNLAGQKVAEVDAAGYLITWTRDVYGNVSTETKYAKRLSEAATPLMVTDSTTLAQINATATTLATAPSATVTGDRITNYTYDRLNRTLTESRANVAQGSMAAWNTTTSTTVTLNGSTLTKTGGTNNTWGDAEAYSNSTLTGAAYVSARAGQTTLHGMFGLNADPTTDKSYTSLDYAWYTKSDGTLEIYESNVNVTNPATGTKSFGPYTTTDVLAIEYKGTTVNYLKNGAVIRSVTTTAGRTFSFDSSFYSTNFTLNDIQFSTPPTTTYAYDGLNNVTQKTDAANATTNWVYDNVGRQTRKSDPVFTDSTGNTAARVRADLEYDGLNNLKRIINRGATDTADSGTLSSQVETDDQITTYTYSTGGRLIAETDATGDVIQYAYDNTGNIITKTLKNRRTADQILTSQTTGIDDVSTYTYDNLNRQLSSSTKSTAETTYTFNEVQYNSFGEVINKRTYTNSTGAVGTGTNGWDEFAEYDQAGRVFKTNSEDGVVKVMLYDKNGNVTMKVTSSDAANTIASTQNTQTGLTTLLGTANTLRSMSVYDARNQLLKTIQAAMDINHQVGAISTTTGTNTLANSTNPLTTNVDQALPPNPINRGMVGSGGGTISWTMTISSGAAAVGGNIGKSGYLAGVVIDVPDSVTGTLGGDALRVYVTLTINNNGNEIWYNSYSGYGTQGSKITMPKLYIGNDLVDKVVGISFTVYKSIGSQEIEVATASKIGTNLLGGYTTPPSTTQVRTGTTITGQPIYSTVYTGITVPFSAVKNSAGNFNSPSKFYFAAQPYGTDRLLLSYRPAGSSEVYKTISVPAVLNTSSQAVTGYYGLDYSSIPQGNYEFNYAAMNATGDILNQQSGTFNTSNATSPTISPQADMLIGGLGRGFVSDATSTGLGTNGLQIVNQGSNADSITLKYRVKGSSGVWSSIAPASFVKSAANSGYGLGHFSLATSAMSMFANGTTYEVELEVRDSSNNLLRITSTEITRNTAGVLSANLVFSLKKLRLVGQSANASYVDISYRATGSTGAYSTAVRIYPTAANSGLFDWDITGMPVGNQDISIKSYDTNNTLLSNYQFYTTFGANSAVINAVSSLNNPRYITINPPNANSVDYVMAGYRLKNTAVEYTLLPISTTVMNGSTKEFRINIPILNAGDYEYTYTAYAADVARYVDPASITITPSTLSLVTTPPQAPQAPQAPIYSEDFNGSTQDISMWDTGSGNIYVSGAGTTSGKLVIKTGLASTQVWPGFESNTSFSYTAGHVLRTEISLGASSSGRAFTFEIGGEDAAGNGRAHNIQFVGDSIAANTYDETNGWQWNSSSLETEDNTTYVVEFEMSTTGTTLYVYKKGLTRAEGWSNTDSNGAWGSYTYGGSSHDGPGVGVTEDSIDSITIAPTPPSVVTTPAPQSASYSEDFNGSAQDISMWDAGSGNIYVSGAGTTSGKLVIKTGLASTQVWPGFESNTSFSYTAGHVLRTEISLGASSSGRAFTFEMRGEDAAGHTRVHNVQFINDGMAANAYDETNGWQWNSSEFETEDNTTYVVEFEMSTTGTTLYVYKKGLTRAEGWSNTDSNGAWSTYHYDGSFQDSPGTGVTEDNIDNITVGIPGDILSTSNSVKARYAVKVTVPANPPPGYVPPELNWIDVSSTQVTSADGEIQYKLDLPENLTEDEYLLEYQTYTLVIDPASPNYNTYQWTVPVIKEFTSTIHTTPLESNIGEFTILANSTGISNTQSQWNWISPTSSMATIARQQSYNAFGEIATETDGLGNVSEYTYNTLGNLIRKQDPTVSITLDNGFKQNTTPITTYTYDTIGRVTAVVDANGNVNRQTWLAGGSGEQTVSESHADSGIKTRKYDVFGNKVSETDEVGRTTLYAYDKDNQLIQVTHPSGAVDKYTYDEAGQRVAHTNALNDVEKTYYDSVGRVTQTKTNMGFATSYSYVYTTNVIGLGGATVSGWITTTTDAVGRTSVDTNDMFKRTFKHKDLGDHVFTYNYNRAGWLTSQTSTSGQNIVYSHYNNGYIKSIHDKALGMYTFYEYDKGGNKTFEGYVSLKDANDVNAGYEDYFQQATITYDKLNRMTSVEDPRAVITYEYDAVGNRRMVRSEYKDGINGANKVQEYWYKYDKMNRFLITMGQLPTVNDVTQRGTSATDTSKQITQGPAGGDGVSISYNLAGERVQAVNAKNGNNNETYTYSLDGYLTDITINGVLRGRRTNDILGRTTNLTEYASNGVTVSYSQTTTYDSDNRTLTQQDSSGNKTWFDYFTNNLDNAYSATGAGELAHTFSDSDGNGNRGNGTIIDTTYDYEYWDEAKMSAITADPYNRAIKKSNRKWANGYSDIQYDVNGHISGAIDRQGNRNFRYISDAQGVVLLRDEITGAIERPNYRYYASTYNAGSVANKVERFYYVDGKAVGSVGNDGPSRVDYVQSMAKRGSPNGNYAGWVPVASADFDQNYEPVSPSNPGTVASTYTVRSGDTLQSIARTVWGDPAMWYLIADANGLTSGSELSVNQTLIIPNKVTNIHNNAGTFRPYNPGEAIGDLNPTIPAMPKPPKKKGCGGIGMIIAAVVAVVATVLTAGALAPAAGGILAGAVGTSGFVIGAVAGVVGSIAGQLAGMALGVQDKFSWSAVAAGAIGGAIGGSVAPFGQGAGGFAGVGNAIAGNIVNQGIGIITGQQKGFSWASVAASVIATPITSKIRSTINGSDFAQANPTNAGIAGAASGILTTTVNELTRVAISGGKVNWSSVAIGGAQGAVYGYIQGLDNQENKDAIAARQEASSRAEDPRMSLRPNGQSPFGEGYNVAGGWSGQVDAVYQNNGTAGSGTEDDPYLLLETNVSGEWEIIGNEGGLLNTSPFGGGLSVKNGSTANVKQQAEFVNGINIANEFDEYIINQQGSPAWIDAETGAMGWALPAQPEIIGVSIGGVNGITYHLPAPDSPLMSSAKFFGGYAAGLGKSVVGMVYEPLAMVADNVTAAYTLGRYALTGDLDIIQPFSSAGKMYQTGVSKEEIMLRSAPLSSIYYQGKDTLAASTNGDYWDSGESFGGLVFNVGVTGYAATQTKGASGDGVNNVTRTNNAYEVIAEVPISGSTRGSHRASANRNLANMLFSDSELSGMFNQILNHDVLPHMQTGKSLLNPQGTVWHHPANNPSVMQLLRSGEHTNPALQSIMHPEGIGGYGTFYGN
ncbi:Rhs family protein [Methylophilaceae bacterium 11]|nr:Rhs family protein [Methylophilaceae bacterium 11]